MPGGGGGAVGGGGTLGMGSGGSWAPAVGIRTRAAAATRAVMQREATARLIKFVIYIMSVGEPIRSRPKPASSPLVRFVMICRPK